VLLLDRDTQRVYRLHDFSKAHHLAPKPSLLCGGKINSVERFYLVIESGPARHQT
jgi:hypothetical protein